MSDFELCCASGFGVRLKSMYFTLFNYSLFNIFTESFFLYEVSVA